MSVVLCHSSTHHLLIKCSLACRKSLVLSISIFDLFGMFPYFHSGFDVYRIFLVGYEGLAGKILSNHNRYFNPFLVLQLNGLLERN